MKCLQFGGICDTQCTTYPCNTLRGYQKGKAETIEEILKTYSTIIVDDEGLMHRVVKVYDIEQLKEQKNEM